MNAKAKFDAPWSRELRWMTTLAFVVCIGVSIIGVATLRVNLAHPAKILALRWGTAVLPLLLLIGCAFFMVRGYTLADHKLIIHRLGWSSRLDLKALVSAASDPLAFSGSIRLAGNGGLFAFCGLFHSRKLGNFRAFATDPHRSVVLKFSNRTVVVTPDAPEKFADEVKKLA